MGAWQQIAPLPNPRYRVASCFHDGKVYVIGGIDPVSGSSATTYIYTPGTNTWAIGAPAPEALGGWGAYAFSVGTKIHVLTPEGKHYRYDPAANTWDTRAPNTILRTRSYALQDGDDRIYFAGGVPAAGGDPTVKVERYDPGTNAWTTLADGPSFLAGDFAIAQVSVKGDDGRLFTGYHSNVDDLVVYNPADGTWSKTATLPPSAAFSGAYNLPVSRLANGLILALPANYGSERRRRVDGYDPDTGTWTMGVIPDFPGAVLDFPAVATDPTGLVYLISGQDNYGGATSAQAYVYLENRAPNAPTLTTMVGNALISTGSTNRAQHLFNDPDTGDSQSAFELRYRIVGDATWTTVLAPVPNPFYDFPAGTFTPNDYERQVRTYDAGGLVGPWSSSGFFTADDPPAGPTITYPINGQDAEQSETLVWSSADQDAYQVRRVADDGAGAPDTGTIYQDTGEVTTALIRSLALTFATNNRTEHIQVRVKNDGLWSEWVSVMVNVDYSPPMVPTLVTYVDTSTASLLLMITNPAPTGGAPVTVYNDVYVDDGDGEERKATAVATNTGWRYMTPRSGRDYSTAIRVVAVAANGTTSSSS